METSYKEPILVAEIGCNHKGDMKIAKELLLMVSDCGVRIAKFQKRNVQEFLTEEKYNKPHPNPINSYGGTYAEHREYLEFDIDQHKELKLYAESLGIIYSSSVWDEKSAKQLITLDPLFIKVPSACNNNFNMLRVLRDDYLGDIHVSFGMTTHQEEEELVSFFEKENQESRLVVYACTSGYPVPFDDICMLEILRIKEKFNNRVKDIGFSGHHLGIAVDIAAYSLGATYIERHVTLNRTWKGTDHAASLESTGLRKLYRDLQATYRSLTYKRDEILEIEKLQRYKLKFKKK